MGEVVPRGFDPAARVRVLLQKKAVSRHLISNGPSPGATRCPLLTGRGAETAPEFSFQLPNRDPHPARTVPECFTGNILGRYWILFPSGEGKNGGVSFALSQASAVPPLKVLFECLSTRKLP